MQKSGKSSAVLRPQWVETPSVFLPCIADTFECLICENSVPHVLLTEGRKAQLEHEEQFWNSVGLPLSYRNTQDSARSETTPALHTIPTERRTDTGVMWLQASLSTFIVLYGLLYRPGWIILQYQ